MSPIPMVALLDRLEQDEFIVRMPMPGDRRARSLGPAATGEGVISKIETVAGTVSRTVVRL